VSDRIITDRRVVLRKCLLVYTLDNQYYVGYTSVFFFEVVIITIMFSVFSYERAIKLANSQFLSA